MRKLTATIALTIALTACSQAPKPKAQELTHIGALREANGKTEMLIDCSKVTDADLVADVEIYTDSQCKGAKFAGTIVVRGMGDNAGKTKVLLNGQEDWKSDSAIFEQAYRRHFPKWVKTGV
jgi:hypothetical protein